MTRKICKILSVFSFYIRCPYVINKRFYNIRKKLKLEYFSSFYSQSTWYQSKIIFYQTLNNCSYSNHNINISLPNVHHPIILKFSLNSTVQISTIYLNGNNFIRWSQSVQMYIRGRGKISYLICAIQKLAMTDPSQAT